ncbi:hypothetical protein FA95DRAFT_86673 [Auriscalpium vulgare]|uniref:Uncharacterized protein n=1 Tax=Auriscalpium vulgare TaxID=40419 RepID=A0ACB8RPN5_9AGAM|nr:hypothetical protein FA95DRAFT_86673 [Auriscalpium vulgare]
MSCTLLAMTTGRACWQGCTLSPQGSWRVPGAPNNATLCSDRDPHHLPVHPPFHAVQDTTRRPRRRLTEGELACHRAPEARMRDVVRRGLIPSMPRVELDGRGAHKIARSSGASKKCGLPSRYVHTHRCVFATISQCRCSSPDIRDAGVIHYAKHVKGQMISDSKRGGPA